MRGVNQLSLYESHDVEKAANANPPCFWEQCKACGGDINIHSVIYVEPNEACENFDFCLFETGSDMLDGTSYARYVVLSPEEPDTMDLDDFKELYG